MNSARAHGLHRARQAAAVLAGVGVTATGVVAGLAHASDPAAGSRTPTSAARSSSVASSPSVPSGSLVQPGVAGGAPQAQSGGS
jgi:hypothetical protein